MLCNAVGALSVVSTLNASSESLRPTIGLSLRAQVRWVTSEVGRLALYTMTSLPCLPSESDLGEHGRSSSAWSVIWRLPRLPRLPTSPPPYMIYLSTASLQVTVRVPDHVTICNVCALILDEHRAVQVLKG